MRLAPGGGIGLVPTNVFSLLTSFAGHRQTPYWRSVTPLERSLALRLLRSSFVPVPIAYGVVPCPEQDRCQDPTFASKAESAKRVESNKAIEL